MLCIDQLKVRADPFDGPAVLDGVSLNVGRGEAVGLTGPSGCGKTTLLRAIAGLIDPADGSVTLDGKSHDAWGWPVFRRQVGLVPQRPVVWDGTVLDCLSRPFSFNTIDTAFDAQRAEDMLEQLRLSGVRDARAASLSEGERQRLCLIRALLMRPRYLLLDEPTSALDDEAVARTETLLSQQMTEHGLGMLIATHDREQASRFCSRVIDLAGLRPGAKAATDA